MRVDVARPEVSYETVVFSWTQSESNPFQAENRFSFRYQGVDLAAFTNALFFEIFLALQLRVFAEYDEPLEVVFPEPISPHSVAFWQTYHGATNVAISPLARREPVSPWKTGHPPNTLPAARPFGVMFGGGKDSTLSSCMLSEIYGSDQVALFQMVTPYRPDRQERMRIEQRQENLMLRPMRERLGVITHHAWTDFIAVQTARGRRVRPHLELYSVGFLPALLHWGVSLLTTSYAWSAFPFRRLANGDLWFRYPLSRSESLATQSHHYRRTYDIDMTITNVHLLFTPYSAFRLLAERYPSSLAGIVMCDYGSTDERWCLRCRKCVEYAYYTLAQGIVDPRFDYNRAFGRSPFIKEAMAHLEEGVERTVRGNVGLHPHFGSVVTYFSNCHALGNAAIDRLAPHLHATALGNLLMLKAAYGNTPFPETEQIPRSAIDLLGHDTARQMAAIAAEHFEIVDRFESPFDVGGKRFEYDFSVRHNPITANLSAGVG